MITIQGINNTGSTLTYSAENVSIPANSTVTIPDNVLIAFATDSAVVSDILTGNLSISDTVNIYSGTVAFNFLLQIANVLTVIDKTGSGTLTAAQPTQQTPVAGGTVPIITNGASSIGATILGTWVGTIVADGSIDGISWFTISPLNLSTGQLALSFTGNTNIIIGCGSFTQVRLRMSSFTSGSATVNYNAASGNNVILVSNTIAANLNAQVVGSIASGSSDSGNPVKTGAVYNSSLPTPATGKRVDSQANQFGEGAIQFRNKYSNLTGNGTTTVKSGSGRLHGIQINNASTGGTITIFDNTTGSGTKIGTMTIGTPSGGLLSGSGIPGPEFIGPMGLEFSTGLTIVLAGSTSNDITVLYQ